MAGQPGAAAQHYGFSTDANSPYYILGDRYLGKLQSDWSKGITTGGNTQIHKILTGLGTSKTGQNQAFVKADPNLGAKFAQYFRTGDAAAAGITPARARQAYDYALRATGVDAINDRSPGFLGGLVKGNIGSIIGTVGGFALGGPMGAKIGGTLGGAAQGAYSGGFKGALTGGLSGYGIGSGGAWLGGKVAPGFSGAFPSSGWWSQPAVPVLDKMNLGAGAKAANSLATGFPGSIIPSLGGKTATAAANSGFFGNLGSKLSGAFDMGTLNGWTNLGKAGMAATSAYNYLNPVSGQRQMNDLEARVAALFGNPNDQYQPYNVTTPLSQVQFDGQNINVNPNKKALNSFNQYMDLMKKAGGAAANVDTAGLSQDFYNQLNALQGLQEADEMRRLESVLFNRGGVHTGTQNQIADFQSRLDAARQSRQFDAINAALAYQGDLYNQFQGLGQGVIDFNAGLFNPYAQQSITAGAYDAESALKAKDYLADLQVQKASQSYLDERRERDYLNDALSLGFDFLGGL